MATDNLEIFKKVIFHLPSLKATMGLMAALSSLYSVVLFLMVDTLLLDSVRVYLVPLFILSLFLLPGVVSAEIYHFLLPNYPRRWGYFLSLVNQLIIFFFSVLLTFADSFTVAWQIIWLGLVTLYINNFFILILSVGPDHMRRISVLSLIQPVMILVSFHVVMGRFLQISLVAYLANFVVILGAGLVLLLAVHITEFLVGSNVSNISILKLAAALLQNKQEKLDLGKPVRPDVQTLEIGNRSGVKRFAIPWLHPGPIQGFGGGQITSRIIEEINSDGEEGFFLHIPSNHEMDPSDPKDSTKVTEAMESTEKNGKVSKLVSREFEDFKLYGRRFNGKNVVYLDHYEFDDYEAAILEDVIEKEETTVIDLHNQPKGSRLGEMRYGTVPAEKLKQGLEEFIRELEEQETHDYMAGFAMKRTSKPSAALVERVDGQKTLLFGIEGNDSSKELRDLSEEFNESFDEVLLFTTDTHASIHDLASNKQLEKEEIRRTVEEALADVSPAEIGLSNSVSEEMKFLKDDYYGLIFTINILVRLIPISLVVMYLALVIWLL